jgi:hypothetical protein
LLKRLDALDRLSFVPAASTEEAARALIVRESTTGHATTGVRALAAVVRSLPFGTPLWLVLKLPGVAWGVDQVLKIMARARHGLGVWFGLKTFDGHPAPSSIVFDDSAIQRVKRAIVRSREAAALAFAAVCAIALAGDMSDESMPSGVEAVVYRVVAYPRLFQRWGLFAPEPPKRLGTLVAEAETASGARLDPLTGLPARSTPTAGPAQRPEPLMAAYFTSISQPSRSTYVNELREYVRRVGDRRGPAEKLVWFNVDWIESPVAEPEESPSSSLEASPIAAVSRRITSGP